MIRISVYTFFFIFVCSIAIGAQSIPFESTPSPQQTNVIQPLVLSNNTNHSPLSDAAPLQTNQAPKRLTATGKIGVVMNDTDVWSYQPINRGYPLAQKNNHNYTLHGTQILTDDEQWYQSLLGMYGLTTVMMRPTRDISVDIDIRAHMSEVLKADNIYVDEVRIATFSWGGGLLLAQIGHINPYFTDYTLDLRGADTKKDLLFYGNADTGVSKTRGAVAHFPIGAFLKQHETYIGNLDFYLVAGRAEKNSDYPNGGQYSKTIYPALSPTTNIIVYLHPAPGVKEIKEDIPNGALNINKTEAAAFHYWVTITAFSNTTPIATIVHDGIIASPYTGFIDLDEERILISAQISSVIPGTTKYIIEWSDKDPHAAPALYLNCLRLQWQPGDYCTIGGSYVNLHHDIKSFYYRDEYRRPIMHSELLGSDISLNLPTGTDLKTEYAHSRYQWDNRKKPNTIPFIEGNIFYIKGTQKFEYDTCRLTGSINYRDMSPNYALNIYDIRYVRVLADDTNNNGIWDYEERNFAIGQHGYGSAIDGLWTNAIGLHAGASYSYDYQKDYQSTFLITNIWWTNKVAPIQEYTECRVPTPGLDTDCIVRHSMKISGGYNKLLLSTLEYYMELYHWNRAGLVLTCELTPTIAWLKPTITYSEPTAVAHLGPGNADVEERLINPRLDIIGVTWWWLRLDAFTDYRYYENRWWEGLPYQTPIQNPATGNPVSFGGQTTTDLAYNGKLSIMQWGTTLSAAYGEDLFKGNESETQSALDYKVWHYKLQAEYKLTKYTSAFIYYYQWVLGFDNPVYANEYDFSWKAVAGELAIHF